MVRMKSSSTSFPRVPTASGCLHNLILGGNKTSEVTCWWNITLHGPCSLPSTHPSLGYPSSSLSWIHCPAIMVRGAGNDVAECPHPSARGGAMVGWLVMQPVCIGWVDEDPRWHGNLTMGGWEYGELGWWGLAVNRPECSCMVAVEELV